MNFDNFAFVWVENVLLFMFFFDSMLKFIDCTESIKKREEQKIQYRVDGTKGLLFVYRMSPNY